jgi:hypothetical protein
MLTTLTGIHIIHQVLGLTGILALEAGVAASIQACTPHSIMVDGTAHGTTTVMEVTGVITVEVIILMAAIMVGAITPVVTGELAFMVEDIGQEAITVAEVL